MAAFQTVTPKDGRLRLPPFTVRRQMLSLAETIDQSLQLFGIPEVWKSTKAAGARIGVLDTGVDQRHATAGDLKDAIAKAHDFTGSSFGVWDKNGHGSHTAGTIGARANGAGLIGLGPESKLWIFKVLGDSGSGSNDWIAAALDMAIAEKLHAVNLSLGGPEDDPQLHDAVKRAVAAGIYVVCAAGNDGLIPGFMTEGYPAHYPETMSIGAVDNAGNVADFSSRGDNIAVCAPGVNITSLYRSGGYAALSGTSMATPFVTGTLALMVGYCLQNKLPLPSPAEASKLLRDTAKEFPRPTPNSGRGILAPSDVVKRPKPAPPEVAPGDVHVGKWGSLDLSLVTHNGKQGIFIAV